MYIDALSIQRNLWKHNTSKQKELQLAPVQLVLQRYLLPAIRVKISRVFYIQLKRSWFLHRIAYTRVD